VIHRTFRSLDQAPKLVGFSLRQWAALIAGTIAVLGLIFLTHLPTKPAITLCVFVIGLPAALMYVSESGGLQLGVLLLDMCRWRTSRQAFPAVPRGYAGARGLVILPGADCYLADGDLADDCRPDAILSDLLAGERWSR
jgi:hypothetical protein